MLEKVYDTIRGLLYNDMPHDSDGDIVIYDRKVVGWLYGDQTVVSGTPAIQLKGATSPPSRYASGVQKLEHKITIELLTQADNQELSERLAQEFDRLVFHRFVNRTRMWVMDLCPFCLKMSFSPRHFLIDHGSVLAPYVTASQTYFTGLWEETHASGTAPALEESAKAFDAFMRLWEDVRNNVTVANLSNTVKQNILVFQRDGVVPIRLLFNCRFVDNKPSEDEREQKLLHTSNLTFAAEELVVQTLFGPDNVPLTAY